MKEHVTSSSHTNESMKFQSCEGVCEVSFSNQTTLEVTIHFGLGKFCLDVTSAKVLNQILLVIYYKFELIWLLTLILLTWRIWWAPYNANRWQMGFNCSFKSLMMKVLAMPWSENADSNLKLHLLWLVALFHWSSMCRTFGIKILLLPSG